MVFWCYIVDGLELYNNEKDSVLYPERSCWNIYDDGGYRTALVKSAATGQIMMMGVERKPVQVLVFVRSTTLGSRPGICAGSKKLGLRGGPGGTS